MADNRRAGERTIFRGNVEDDETLAEIARVLDQDRRAPIAAVREGFVAPAGGQASNIPAMADLEEELLREFALYEGPREPQRRVEPAFAPEKAFAAAPSISAAKAALPATDGDEDDTMPPMGAIPVFSASRVAPVKAEPSSAKPRVEPIPPVVSSPASVEASRESSVDFAAQAKGIDDFAAPDAEPEDAIVDAATVEDAEAEGHAVDAVEPAFDDAVVSDADPEPVFAGPVPDFDFDDEPSFAGPVPDLNLEDDLAFSGPVPELDLSEGELGDTPPSADFVAEATAAPQPEAPLGALDIAPEKAGEPASPFAAWKNDRLSAPLVGEGVASPVWLSAGPAVAEAVEHGVEPSEAAASLLAQPLSTTDSEALAPKEAFDDFDLQIDADDLMADLRDLDASAGRLEVSPAVDMEPRDDAKASDDSAVESFTDQDLSISPDADPVAEEKVLEQPFLASARPSLDHTPTASAAALPDWLQPAKQSAPKPVAAAPQAPAEASADPLDDFADFEFDFDEDAIEAEVSRAVLSELKSDGVSDKVLAPDELPFDPSQISEIEERMPVAVTGMDVPQIPEGDAETQAKPASDFDYDIEAEMAELFALGNKSKAMDGAAKPTGGAETDDDAFDQGLANEIIRSIHETPAIPVGRAFNVADMHAAPATFVSRYARFAAGAALIAFAGVGAVMLWRSGDVPGLATGGPPAVILADKSPVKEVPENPGGKQVPNQDKAVYDRVSGKTKEELKQDSLIATAEEPVDVAEKTLENDAQVPGVTADDAAKDTEARLPGANAQAMPAGQQANDAVTPRKVKTMIVLPNGTLVAREDSADTTANDSTKAAAAPVLDPATIPATEAQPLDAAAPQGAGADGLQAATPPASEAKPVAAPIPVPRPAEQPVNVVGTVTQRGNVVDNTQAQAPQKVATAAPQPATTPNATVPAGSYVIQIASLPSKEEAQKSYANLSSKFASVIGGKGVDIKPAEIAGKGTYYRVRIVAGSREDAIALCTRYKAAGGSCLVSR